MILMGDDSSSSRIAFDFRRGRADLRLELGLYRLGALRRARRSTWPRQSQLERSQEVRRQAEEDDGLQNLDDAARNLGVALHYRAAGVQRAEEDRGEHHPDGAVQPKQRHGNAVEACAVIHKIGIEVMQ